MRNIVVKKTPRIDRKQHHNSSHCDVIMELLLPHGTQLSNSNAKRPPFGGIKVFLEVVQRRRIKQINDCARR